MTDSLTAYRNVLFGLQKQSVNTINAIAMIVEKNLGKVSTELEATEKIHGFLQNFSVEDEEQLYFAGLIVGMDSIKKKESESTVLTWHQLSETSPKVVYRFEPLSEAKESTVIGKNVNYWKNYDEDKSKENEEQQKVSKSDEKLLNVESFIVNRLHGIRDEMLPSIPQEIKDKYDDVYAQCLAYAPEYYSKK